MKVGDRVRDWQGAVEGHGEGKIVAIHGDWATVLFANVKADVPLSHLELLKPSIIVHFVNVEGDQTTFGFFSTDHEALAWIDGRRQDHPGMGGHFTIDRLSPPTTWDSKLSEYTVTWHPQIASLAHDVKETVVEAESRQAAIRAVANDYPAPIIVVKVRP